MKIITAITLTLSLIGTSASVWAKASDSEGVKVLRYFGPNHLKFKFPSTWKTNEAQNYALLEIGRICGEKSQYAQLDQQTVSEKNALELRMRFTCTSDSAKRADTDAVKGAACSSRQSELKAFCKKS